MELLILLIFIFILGFVYYHFSKKTAEAKKAKEVLDNSYFEGRILKVDKVWPLRDIRIIER